MTDEVVATDKELMPESDEDEEEMIRSGRIKSYQERGVQLSPNGCAVMPACAPSGRVFPIIGDNRTTCMMKNIEPSAGIYDLLAHVDPAKTDKHVQRLKSHTSMDLCSTC